MRALGLTGRQGRERRNPRRSGIGFGRSSNGRLLKWFWGGGSSGRERRWHTEGRGYRSDGGFRASYLA
ncbi:hypothetical protein ACSQ67_025478 [Phaseolus vulgaris]